jgi:hypothetical protein
MVQGDIGYAAIVMLNLVQHLVITDYGFEYLICSPDGGVI